VPATGTTPPNMPAPRRDRFPEHRQGTGASPGEYGDGQIVGAALWHTWQGMRSQGLAAAITPVIGRVNEAVWATGYSPTLCPYTDSTCDVNVYRGGRELLQHLADAWLRSDAPQTVNKLLSAFARAGIFLAPASCLMGTLGNMTAPIDPHFCGSGKTAADAIIDITDGVDGDAGDARERFGIRFKDEDFVARPGNPNATPPTFRIWTGAPFVFGASGSVSTAMSPPLCNDTYRIYVRRSGANNTWLANTAVDSTVPTGKCAATQVMDRGLFNDVTMVNGMPDPAARIKIEYKVVTHSSTQPGMERDSTRPGANFWVAPTADGYPAVFFMNVTGHTDL
jgi:hypothetical protein